MKTKFKKILQGLFIVFLVGILLTSCTKTGKIDNKAKYSELETTQDLKRFNSIDELKKFLKESQQQASSSRLGGILEKSMAMADSLQASPAIPERSEAGGAADYSTTNIQVAGVDEADFVKNDNEYIYMIAQNRLVIVDAFPAENAKIVSETELKGTPQNMLLNDDKLVIFTVDYENRYAIPEYDFMPRPIYSQNTKILVYDVKDRKNPKLENDYSMDGYYYESRMIGNYVYFIVKDNVNYYDYWINAPEIKSPKMETLRPEIYYFDNPEYGYTFNTVAAFNINDDASINAKTFMMGYANNLYVSKDSIYISYQKNMPYVYGQKYNEERFYDVILVLLPDKVQDEINDIKNDKEISPAERWSKISGVLEEMYNSMDENEKQDLIDKIGGEVEAYEIKQEQDRRKTVIHKIGISNGDIKYEDREEVPGYILNQFSMDESGGYFRVATTTYIYTSKSIMYNNVYVLDGNMKIVGKLEDIAPDERIYSTRFIGDRLYMVTFKRIDPLFVIDLSDARNPEILGKLKIPGYSDYLHPYDKDHIIGIGKETDSNEWGGVSTRGVKLAFFDVSDVSNPKLVDKYEIGQEGSDSEALYEHKAFLFDKKKNILVIPVREVKGRYYNTKYGYYDWRTWRGAYVFGLNTENGFELKGKITHSENNERDSYGWWSSLDAVRRSLYMDDVLYTVSGKKIKANDINNID
ncbi:beta-propeller domain-containing protein, partial [Candidatus Woesearchaeota archaeon]|nr:beta-propeller domain-containing protein [Candidatus Woesearchaeota archaeon]